MPHGFPYGSLRRVVGSIRNIDVYAFAAHLLLTFRMQTASTAPHGDSAAPCPAERVRAGSSSGRHQHQRGLFLTFEGIDGAGKSSHISSLADEFRRRGAQVVQTREPGVRQKTWTGYVVSPRLRRYSMGLRAPSEILIRSALYQRI